MTTLLGQAELSMSNFAVIGDSHGVHLKKALDLPNTNKWLLAPSREGTNISHLSISQDVIESKKTELTEILRKNCEDPVISLDTKVIFLIGLRSEFPYLLMSGTYSISAIETSIEDYLNRQSLLIPIVERLRLRGFKNRIKVITNPFISEVLLKKPIKTAPGIKPVSTIAINSLKNSQTIKNIWYKKLNQLLKKYNAQLVLPPEDVLVDKVFTSGIYARGTKNAGELRHMTSEYWKKFQHHFD